MNNKGFTLIELLAVVVILAVVMGIAMTTVLSSMNKARAGALSDSATAIAQGFNTKYTYDRLYLYGDTLKTSILSEKFISGTLNVQVILSSNDKSIITKIREAGFAVSVTKVFGQDENNEKYTKHYGMGVEMEIDNACLSDRLFYKKYMEYIALGAETGYMTDTVNMYYQSIGIFGEAARSASYMARSVYDVTYHYIKGDLKNLRLRSGCHRPAKKSVLCVLLHLGLCHLGLRHLRHILVVSVPVKVPCHCDRLLLVLWYKKQRPTVPEHGESLFMLCRF